MKRRLLFFFLLVSSLATAQNNIYRSGGITQTVGAPTFTPGASGNIVAIDTVTGEWYVNPNRLSGSSWISAGYRLTNISGSVPPAYTPTAHQSHFVVNAANELYYWDGSTWQSVGGGGSTDALRLKFLVVNKSGVTLNKGDVVYVSGAQGNRIAVKKALATADSISANTLGVVDQTIADNAEGYCVAEGIVTGLNTSSFTEGAALYLSPITAGAITQTKPTAPNHLVLIGYCVKSNNGSGEISVHIQNGYELGELHDVYLPAPGNGQVLTYNSTNSRWEAATVADQSATNEIQRLDTFSLSGQTLRASLLNDGVAASSVMLPIIDVVAGTNVTVSKSNGVATVSATGGGGGSGTVTGTGVAGRVAFWRSTSVISSDANFAWDSTNVQFNINAPSSPTGRLNVKGSGTLTTVNTRLTNSGHTELFKVLDNGNTNIGTAFNWDNVNGRLGIGTASPSQALHVTVAARIDGTNVIVDNRGNGFLTQSASTTTNNRESVWGNGTYAKLRAHTKGFYVGASFPAADYLLYVDGGTGSGSLNREGIYLRPTQPAAGGNTNGGDVIIELPAGTGTGRRGAVLIGTATATGPSAIMEISSTNQGLLLPRMTGAQAEAIPTPADGLLIYANNGNGAVITSVGFWGYSAGAWSKLN